MTMASEMKDIVNRGNLWGRKVDLAGVEYFSIVIDPIDGVDYSEDGICGLMQMPVDVLTETLFGQQEESIWFRSMYVLWGQAISAYDDDDMVGIRCTIIGYR